MSAEDPTVDRPWLVAKTDREIARDIRSISRYVEFVPTAEALVAMSYFAALLDEGHEALAVVTAVTEHGISTVEGVRAFLTGSPAEWARSFEEGAEE